MTGTVFLTGGTGKTSIRIASKLQGLDIPVLLASRKGQAGVPTGFDGVKFDWYDETTYENPFSGDKNIDTVYIIVPCPAPERDAVASTKQFINVAREKGVQKFLLMSSVFVAKGDTSRVHGQIHAYLEAIGVDFAVIRPSAFFGNFLHVWPSIRTRDEYTTATGEGKIGFLDEDDIADVAVQFLTASKLGGVERIIVGPELLSHNQIAEQLSQVLGRKITHRTVSADERKSDFIKRGMPEQIATLLSVGEASFVASGTEEKIYSETLDKAVGKSRFFEFAQANKAAWQK